MFVLIVVVLTSVYIIVSDGVSPLIITLFSSSMTLPIPYDNNGNYGYNDLLIALNIKPNAYNLDDYSPDIYGLPI